MFASYCLLFFVIVDCHFLITFFVFCCCWCLIFGYYCFVCCVITFICMWLVALLAGAWVLTTDLVQFLIGISGLTYCGMDTLGLLALEGSHCLPSPLNLPRAPSQIFFSALLVAMQHHLDQHLASYILSGLTNGFHIGFDHRCHLQCNGHNHPSATEHPLIMQQHIEVERAKGSLVCPLSPSLAARVHVSPPGAGP